MTDTTQNRKFRYRITHLPKYKRGFDQEQLNVLALAVLNEVNAAQVDLEYEKHHARRTEIIVDPNFQYTYSKVYRHGAKVARQVTVKEFDRALCWDFHIPKCKCVISIIPTTAGVRELFKRLDIKVEKETL